MRLAAKTYIGGVVLAGAAVLGYGLTHWQSADIARHLCYLGVALLAAGFKVKLPGINGTISVTFFFILLGVAQLSFAETLTVGCGATLLQCFWHSKMRTRLVQVLFNVASIALAIGPTYWIYHLPAASRVNETLPVLLFVSASLFFGVNTLTVAAVIALTEGKPLRSVWKQCYFWSFPHNLVGAALAGLLTGLGRHVGWQTSVLVLPVVYVIYRSYHLYLGRLEDEKKHVEDMAGLHLRTIEALAMAIDAKDCTTHAHLQRVQTYAMEIAKDLKMGEAEMQALRAAAVLHDIGKLAVPEHIISKPGRLTPEEFEKMKIHPVVGAEILEQVKFPYPVVPIVRSHHERWDGSGYPHGLKGEAIPMGARILGAVDCLDALASDRQYRRALPLEEAMAQVAAEAGRAFDPHIVSVLQRRYIELEAMARSRGEPARIPALVKVENGAAPGAGFEKAAAQTPRRAEGHTEFLFSIAAARAEAQALLEIAHELGTSLSLDETLSLLAVRLKRLVPYDCIAIYIRRESRLVAEYVSGENFRLFSSLEIPMGDGLSGWVAQNRKPIVNGNPSVEPGYLNDPSKFSTLRSALAVPLEGGNGVVGVLAMYHAERDAFTRDHLRILLAISAKVALSIENALKYRQVESSATTDALTGLPNARSLFLHLDSELARAKRSHQALAVLVCDLDGFKQVNDRFGHLAGNKVLAEVGRALRETCREYDYAARMGGDEFVLVLPGIRAADIPSIHRRLSQVTGEAGRVASADHVLSLSVGEAFYPEDGADAEQLLAEADRRMYKTKHWQKLVGETTVETPAFNWEMVQ